MAVTGSKRLGALAIASLFVVGACSSGATPGTSTAASAPADGASAPPLASVPAVEGAVSVSGSSTVQPISQLVGELFNEQNPNVAVTVDGPGFSFSRPVRLSRNQEVELEVLSYLDIGLALFVGLAFVIGLPLIRRPDLRLSIRRVATNPSSLRWSSVRMGSNRK